MIHIYCGDGKGKTTAAMGLAVRAAGSGMKVLVAQFFKGGESSEIKVLSSIEGVDTMNPDVHYGRFKKMTDEQKAETEKHYALMLGEIIAKAQNYDLIILDESISAYNYGMLDNKAVCDFLAKEKDNREIVLTGRNPARELTDMADYVTEMKKIKHPFDRGIFGRKGIEY